MARMRRKFKVSWDDREPIQIVTSASDVVASSDYTDSQQPAAVTFALLYAALVRLGHEPPPFDEWLEQLDEVQDDGTAVTVEGPIPPVPWPGALSPSPASPAATTEPSSTGTTTGHL